MELNYEQDLKIDETALDIECLDQAILMMRYSKELARAEKRVSNIKEELSVERAELDKDIRSNPDTFGIEKITESAINNCIILQDDYKAIQKKLIDAQYEAKMIKGAVDAVQQRKDMLQELVKLHGQRYFAGPKVERDLSGEVAKKHSRSQSNQAIKIKRTRQK